MISDTAAWCLAVSERSEVFSMFFGKISTWILYFKVSQMVISSSLLKESTRWKKVFSFDEIHGVHGDLNEIGPPAQTPHHQGLKMGF